MRKRQRKKNLKKEWNGRYSGPTGTPVIDISGPYQIEIRGYSGVLRMRGCKS